MNRLTKQVRNVVVTLSVIAMFAACAKENLMRNENAPMESHSSTSSGMTQVNDEGYLTFPSLDLLQQCLEEISNDLESGQSIVDRYLDNKTTRSGNQRTFISLAAQEKAFLTRSVNNDNDDDEEMTLEEFNIAKADELLYEDSFTHIMDATLRVIAGDKLYQITEYGTFVAPLNKVNLLPETIQDFAKLSGNMTQLTEDEFLLSNGITYINTFQGFEMTDITREYVDEEPTIPNCVIYKVNLNAPLTRLNAPLTRAGDDDEATEGEDWGTDFNYFSSTRRMRSKLYRVNYGVGRYAGYKCKYQKRKKFLGIKYWVKTNASKMDITINHMELAMQLTLPSNPAIGDTPLGRDAFAAFSSYVGNQAYTAVVRAVGLNPPFLKGWAQDAIGITMGNFTDKVPAAAMDKVYNMPDDKVKGMFKGFVNKRLEPLKRAIRPTDQRIALLGWGRINLVRTFTTGSRSWTNTDKQNITFVNEGGISVGYGSGHWSVKPQMSIQSTVKKLDVTSTVTVDGTSRSIRVIKD